MPCDLNTGVCKNGATCTNDNKGGYTCTAPIGYTGKNAEIGTIIRVVFLKKDIRLVIKFLNFQIKLYHVIWLIHVKTRQVARTIIWAVLHAHVQKDTAELIVQLVRIEISSCKHQKLLIKKK